MAKVLSMVKGDVIVREGEESDSIFYLKSGKLNVFIKDSQNKKQLVGCINEGELVGEMAFVENKPRSATVIADCASELVLVSHNSFDQSIKQLPPWLSKFIYNLMRRLRENNEIVKDIQKEDS